MFSVVPGVPAAMCLNVVSQSSLFNLHACWCLLCCACCTTESQRSGVSGVPPLPQFFHSPMPRRAHASPSFRFAHQDIDGRWFALPHGVEFQERFNNARSAAAFVATKLAVPVAALRKGSSVKVSKVSKKKGVSWHSAKLGWVFRTEGCSCSKSYLTECGAAHAGGKTLQDSTQSKQSVTRSPYKHVHWHKGKKSWSYGLKIKGKICHGSGYASPKKAGDEVSQLLGISINVLRKLGGRRKPNRSRVMEVLKPMLQVYCRQGKRRWDGALPGDVLDVQTRLANRRSAVHWTPAVKAVIFLAKYGPWRNALELAALTYKDALLATCKESQGSHKSQGSQLSPDSMSTIKFDKSVTLHFGREADVMYQVLTLAVRLVEKNAMARSELEA